MGQLTSTGYTRATKEEIKELIFLAWRAKAALGATFLSSPDSPQTAIADSIAESIATVDEAIAAVFAAMSRTNAVGVQLDNIGDIIGVPRRQATRSTVTATVNLNPGVTLPAGSQAADVTDDAEIYETLTAVTNSGGAAADVTVEMQAVTAGSSTFVSAGQLTEIVTPVTGWNSVNNVADSLAGTDLETDAAYRLRQPQLLSAAGTGTVDAIRAAVQGVVGVTSADVLDNVATTGMNGVPAYSFEVLVIGGDDDAVAQAIWDNKPAGTSPPGTESGTAIDTTGENQTVRFSRPAEIDIFASFTLVTGVDYPGDAAFQESIVAAAASFFALGDDVIYAKLFDLAFNTAGVEDVTDLRIGLTASPTGQVNLPVAVRQISAWDTSRITVT